MSLELSHGAFKGSCSAFNRFRCVVALAAGGSYPPHDDPELDENLWYHDTEWSKQAHPGLTAFFDHDDDNGALSPQTCAALADELEELLPAIRAIGGIDRGHIAQQGGFGRVARKFIRGCREAAAAGEELRFE